MICPEKETLMLWLDGELATAEHDRISHHIESCEACKAFVSAQKRMESVWRNEWVDPAESVFHKMRTGVAAETVSNKAWWNNRRTWYIAAAVCAVYMGVKVFYIDREGASLSEIALNEVTVVNREAESREECYEAVDDSPDFGCVETVETIVEETTEIKEIEEMEEMVAQETVEQPEILLSLSSGDCVSGEDSSVEVIHISGASDVPQQLLTESVSAPCGTTGEIDEIEEESETLSLNSDCLGLSVCDQPVAGGGGMGGLAAYDDEGSVAIAERTCAFEAQQSEDDTTNRVVSDVSACCSFRVFLLRNGDELSAIQRSDWNSLFLLIDQLNEKNCFSPEQTLVFSVDSVGSVHGTDVPVGTKVDIPAEDYCPCTVSIHFL